MTLQELSTKLQNLCHDGHSLDEVYIDTDGNNESLYEIEVRRVTRLGINKKKLITLVAWSKREVADESGK